MNPNEHFEALVNEHYYPLFRFAMSLTHAESDARDLTQHTFYTWAAKGHQLRDEAKAKTWLYTTLHRAFLQARRRQVRFPHHDLEEVAQQLPPQLPEFANSADCAEVLPALAKVDEIFRAAIALYYLEDCSYKEIAAILDVPIGTVKSRIARGLVQLREILVTGENYSKTTHVEFKKGESAPKIKYGDRQDACPTKDADGLEKKYDDWDLGSTRVMELFCAA
jgi:RNA polymerase sigma-70 factor (ECF subfamily)